MSNVRLVLADLDGTVVLPETHTASEAVIQAIQDAKSRGIAFAAVTGRPYWMTKDLLKALSFDDPCIFEGGGLIMNPVTEEVLWSRTVPAETAKMAVSILMSEASLIRYGEREMNAADVDLSNVTEPALSIWTSVPAEKAADLVSKLRALPEVAVHVNQGPGGDFTRTGIQITHLEADKEHAVGALLDLLHVDKEHTMAVGDGANDLPLFRAAKVKVAMGNASEELKQAADHVVAPVSEDGFAEALHRFAL